MRDEFLVETYATERLKVVSVWSEFRDMEDSGKRLGVLQSKEEDWWESETDFFDVKRSMAWVVTRRIAHTSHHRGQQIAMLRMLKHDLYSNYGPTADTGGLMQNHAPTVYAYDALESLLRDLESGAAKRKLPGGGDKPVTERPARQ